MPFSFKPEISSTAPEGQAPVTPQASFGTTSTTNLMERAKEQGKSLLQVLLFGILGLAVLIAVGMFGYSYYLSSQIESKKATLASYESRLGTLPLEDMRKLSIRIKVINQLLKDHPSVNVAFRIIEDSVENQTIYNRFDLRYNESSKGYLLQLTGTAPTYKGVAQQVDTFKRKPYTTYVPTVTVDSLHPDTYGGIGFTLKMPISIAGLLPEGLNLSEGAVERMESSVPTAVDEQIPVGTTTPTGKGSSTPQR